MFATESGPTKNDEINLITAGSNYGWPEVQCFSNNDNFVEAYPHTHPFKNLPLKLYADKDGVRAVGKELSSHVRSQADPVVHEKKGGETL